jgi:hypothetical protein
MFYVKLEEPAGGPVAQQQVTYLTGGSRWRSFNTTTGNIFIWRRSLLEVL